MLMSRDIIDMGAEPAKRVIVLGKGALAIRVADWFRGRSEYRLRCVVPVIPEPGWTDSLVEWSTNHRVPIIATGDHADVPDPGEGGSVCDLAISIYYDRIIRSSFIGRCGRVLNLHNGPLPRYRGLAPINWALKNGERTHGVTIHEVALQVDAGPIVAQVSYDIHPEFDEVIDVYRRALEYGYTLFEQTMPILDRISPSPQDEDDATYYSAADQNYLGDRRDFTRKSSLHPKENERVREGEACLTAKSALAKSPA